MRLDKWIALALVALVLVACGSGLQSPPAEPTPAPDVTGVAVGRVAAFGSIFVNGTEFDTSKSTFDVRGASAADPTSLSVGMVVRVKGSYNSDGDGTASDVRYDPEIDGPAAAVTLDTTDSTIKRFTVFGQNVLASAATVFKDEQGAAYGFADLANGQHVEVSGDFSGGVLLATFIERRAATNTAYQVKGTVSQLSGSRFTLTLNGGRTLAITLAAGALLPAGFANGAFVQLHGRIPDPTRPTAFQATAVAIEDTDDFDGSASTEQEAHPDLAGVLSVAGTTWSVRGTPLKFSASTVYSPAALAAAITDKTAAGLRVHLKGAITGGSLNVDQIRADGRATGAGERKIAGVFERTVPSSSESTLLEISFKPATGTIGVVVDANTLLMNDSAGAPSLKSLQPGVSFVEFRAHVGSGGSLIASSMRIDATPGTYELSGPVDTGGFVSGESVTLLGVKFNLDASTKLVGGTVADGVLVDVTDSDRNGFAEAVTVDKAPAESDFAPP